MTPEIVYIMLTLFCSGHTNAKCSPSIQYFDTKEECEQARIIPGGPNIFPSLFGPNSQIVWMNKVFAFQL